MSNPASELAKKRWRKTSKDERAEVGKALNAARNASMPPEERKRIAKAAAAARWSKKNAARKKAKKG